MMTSPRARIALALTAAALCACASELPPSAFEAGRPLLRPELFFAGTTRSSGVLESRAGAPMRRFAVDGSGELLADGTLRLAQNVRFEQEPPQLRSWLLHRRDEHHYDGTLSDAAGPVEAEAYGNLLHIRYAMKSPPGGRMEQWLYLQPDGRTVVNEATVTVLGLVVTHLSERITHEEEAGPR